MLAGLNRALRRVPVAVVWIAGLIPLAWVIWLVVSGGIGVDPVKDIEHRLGKIALWFLIGGLALSPLWWAGLNLMRFRRAVGLLAFLYVVLHVGAWIWFDMALLWRQAILDLTRRPYLILGALSLILLIPLAVTSNDASIRRLGRRWRVIHRLVYPAVALSLAHYLWQMKVVTPEGWLWLGVCGVLLGLRIVRKQEKAVFGRFF